MEVIYIWQYAKALEPMNFPDIPPDLGKHLAGPAGSMVALFWLNGSIIRKCGMFVAGWAMSFYGAASVAGWLGFNEGFTGFLLGVFGMSIVDKIFEAWNTLKLGEILQDWVRKRLGVEKGSNQ